MRARIGQPRHLGLRARIMVRFAGVAFLLSVMLGTITYVTVRRLVLEDRHISSVAQAVGDARLISAAIDAGQANPSELLASLRPPSRSTPMLLRDGSWFAASLQVRPEDLPQGVTEAALDGGAARQVVRIGERVVSVVGLDLGDGRGAYFEVFSLVDIDSTLQTLFEVLALTGVFTTIAGAILGGLIAQRVLRPLREVTAVARDISAGDLESRLDESLDSDLSVLTASFNRMADTLQDRIAREARFASDVAHELRTPLTTVITSLAVLEGRRSELSQPSREALALLGSDVRRLERTAADLIEIAQHDAGVTAPELEPLPTTTVVSHLLSRLGRADLPVVIDRSAVSSLVSVDEQRLERVLANLVTNADSYGGGATRLSVSAHEGKVRIAVEDQGPGVPPVDRERIFERFARGSTTKSARDSGSGLGLALAAENTRLQGGSIWVEDNPGGGARFVVELEEATT